MRKYVLILSVFFSIISWAQVGINTTDLSTTLKIKALGEDDPTLRSPEGLLIPRISKSRAKQISPQTSNSTIVYINNIDDTDTTGPTGNINQPGFYYFQDNLWINILSENSDSSIYNTSGVLNSDRVVNLQNYKLNFTNANEFKIANALTVAQNNIYIGSRPNSLTSKLSIDNDMRLNGLLKVGTNADPGQKGQVLTSTGNSSPIWQSLTSNSSNYSFNNGINQETQNYIQLGGTLVKDTEVNIKEFNFKIRANEGSQFSVERKDSPNNPILFTNFENNTIGIGTNSPKQSLDLNDNILINGALYLSKTGIATGNPGQAGTSSTTYEYLASNGENNPPYWSTIESNNTNMLNLVNGLQKNPNNTNQFQFGGDLIKNTSINTDGYNLSFRQGESSTTDQFIINQLSGTQKNTTLYAELNTNKKIGVGTNLPTNKLDINGDLRIRTIDNEQDSSNKILTITDEGVVETINSNFADYTIGGRVYAYYTNPSYNNSFYPNEFNLILDNSKLIGLREGVQYNYTPTQTATSQKNTLQAVQGVGFKVSSPEPGIVDIMFDTPFTEVYGASVNIFDTYKRGSNNAFLNIYGNELYPQDKIQISFISNTILRVKTGDSVGRLASRSFTFTITGK